MECTGGGTGEDGEAKKKKKKKERKNERASHGALAIIRPLGDIANAFYPSAPLVGDGLHYHGRRISSDPIIPRKKKISMREEEEEGGRKWGLIIGLLCIRPRGDDRGGISGLAGQSW